MQNQIWVLKKDLKEANEQIAAHKAAVTPANALASVPAPTVAAAQPPPPRRQMNRRPPRCFLCGEEGNFVSNCPARPVLQRLLRQQVSASARGLPRGQILELPQPEYNSQAHPNVQLKC